MWNARAVSPPDQRAELRSHVLRGQQNAKLSRRIYLLETILSFFVSMIADLSRLMVVPCCLTRCPQSQNNQSVGYDSATRNSDSKIQRRRGWMRSLRTVAIQNRLACSCLRTQPVGEGQGLLHAALQSYFARSCPVSRVRAPRQAPLYPSHRVARLALRALLPGSPCARALATRVLRASPL